MTNPEGDKMANTDLGLSFKTTINLAGIRSSSSTKAGQTPIRKRRTRVMSDKKIADDEYMAAAIGDVEWLKQSLRDIGGQINYDKNGLTALHLAAIHGRLDCIRICVEKFKFDINLPSTTGWRPIHLAISNQTGKRSLICLQYLLDNGADSSICNDDQVTPMHQAASEGHVKCLKLLIERGAKVDGRDCRSNSPLDLAKLWNHRKCARILAAEMWHRDKNEIYSELHQLQKFRMQQVLREMEEEDELRELQETYGDEAYKRWLELKHLEGKMTGPYYSRYDLHKPGGQTRDMLLGKETPHKSTYLEESETDSTKAGGKTIDKSTSAPAGGLQQSHLRHQRPWLYFSRYPEHEYTPFLKDEFPRDEYTMMPKTDGSHKYFDGKHLYDAKFFNKRSREVRKPRDIVKKALSADPTLNERPVLYKPKFIPDVHTKRKCDDPDLKPLCEVPLHMYSDFKTDLVQNSLLVPVRLASVRPLSETSCKSSSKTSCKSSGKSSILDKSPSPQNILSLQSFPREMVINTMKQMSSPQPFPNIKGGEYVRSQQNLRA